MEYKILEMCKKVIDGETPHDSCTTIDCFECPFKEMEIDCETNSIEIKEIAQNYIKEHEKTVNTIEKIEENEDISRGLIEGNNFTKATVTLKELQEIKKDNIIPTYYHQGNYDVIQFCNDNEIEFTTGNIIKYITRYKGKNGIEDLKKAKEYLRRLQGTEYDISLADLVHFSLENDLNYTQGKIIELVLGDELTKAGNVLNDLIEKEEKKIREIEETYQTEGMAD